MRALASIKSENQRRQRIFGECDVNNINQYMKLFKQGGTKIPLPHLFIISDEFAELKKEQPDFMSELVTTARIGRSLGVHLILATQKPSGVVDDQIWSNSKFKLALKVQNESDSNEVLKTPDAARITIPGRAYLQVGNNEIYELFQSAWSGATYSEEEVEKGFDNRVYLMNNLGQGELLNEDLSETAGTPESSLTQLDVVVSYIKEVYDGLAEEAVERPWLPSLPHHIVSGHIQATAAAPADEYNLSCAFGMIDIPDEQRQCEAVHDFLADGNFAVLGAPGFGKSTVITTFAMSLAAANTPKNLSYYILDLGNSALIQLKDLPHTADYVTYDQEEKFRKLTRILLDELSRRKQLFAKESAINFRMYNQVASERIPAIILFVDNYDVVREIPIELDEFFIRLTRDGVGVGIYTVISATSTSMVRYAVLNNFKNKISLFMFDTAEIRNVVGRSSYDLPEVRGRAMVAMSGVNVMQCFLPAPFENEIDYAKEIGGTIAAFQALYPDPAAGRIPMLPDVVTLRDISGSVDSVDGADGADEQGRGQETLVPLGLDAEEVLPQHLDLRVSKHLVVGKPKTGKTNALKIILRMTEAMEGQRFIVDTSSLELRDFAREEDVYASEASEVESFCEAMQSLVDARKKSFEADADGMRPKEFYSKFPKVCLIIDDGDSFLRIFSDKEREMGDLVAGFLEVGGTAVTSLHPNGLRGYSDVAGILKEVQSGLVLGNPNDQSIFEYYDRRTKAENGIGYLCGNGEPLRIKLPLV
jgi:S-DNA-T family DNA segregation ATPase FtsK/SpoIIIE